MEQHQRNRLGCGGWMSLFGCCFWSGFPPLTYQRRISSAEATRCESHLFCRTGNFHHSRSGTKTPTMPMAGTIRDDDVFLSLAHMEHTRVQHTFGHSSCSEKRDHSSNSLCLFGNGLLVRLSPTGNDDNNSHPHHERSIILGGGLDRSMAMPCSS